MPGQDKSGRPLPNPFSGFVEAKAAGGCPLDGAMKKRFQNRCGLHLLVLEPSQQSSSSVKSSHRYFGRFHVDWSCVLEEQVAVMVDWEWLPPKQEAFDFGRF